MTSEQLEISTLDSILKDLQIDNDAQHNALSISERGHTVILKRAPSEIMVNNYNKTFMLAWEANMDNQFCLDSYAVLTYITDYLTKGDAGLTRDGLQIT